MIYDALIFDLDGTLWDASESSAKGWNIALKKTGIDKQILTEDIRKVAGNPYKKCIEILLPGLLAKYNLLYTNVNTEEEKMLKKQGGVIYDYVREGIRKLSEEYMLFIVSNCQEWYLKLFFNLSGIKNYFKDYDCYGISNVSKYEMINKIITGYDLKKPVYIGDTLGDEKAAKLSGCDFIYMSYGFGNLHEQVNKCHTFKELVMKLSK